MSKITFRADDDLIRELEEFDASKSEVMRKALRAYLDGADHHTSVAANGSIDGVIADRVDELVDDRLDRAFPRGGPQDIHVNVTLDGDAVANRTVDTEVSRTPEEDGHGPESARITPDEDADDAADEERKTCSQCGESVTAGHVYCPNCGEKASHRVFCECGDELRSDWAFCPSCGRRTPAADVLDQV